MRGWRLAVAHGLQGLLAARKPPAQIVGFSALAGEIVVQPQGLVLQLHHSLLQGNPLADA